VIFVIIPTVFSLLFFHLRDNVTGTVVDRVEDKMRAASAEALNAAVFDSLLVLSFEYSDLFSVVYDRDGNIAMVSAISHNINRLARDVMDRFEQNILRERYIIGLPIGAFSGITLLSNLGREIEIEINPQRSVHCFYESIFESAGINQTLHRIYLSITGLIALSLPLRNIEIDLSSKILIAENLLIGRVPNVYLGSSITRVPNLVP
jgi:sporulation protein YunB